MKSTVAVMLSTSLVMGGQIGQATASAADNAAAEAAKIVEGLIGKDYQYQADGPDSFGSANLATYAYKQVGVKIGDTIAELYKTGEKVSKSDLQAGDLVFFSSTGKGSPNFMGVYIGDGKFVYSSQGEDEVVLKDFSEFEKKFLGATRMVKETSSDEGNANDDSASDSLHGEVANIAEGLIGKAYKYQANGPNSFGSANLATYAYKQVGINVGDTIAVLYKTGKEVSASNLQAGDLVFFSSNGKGSPSFMGIYIGGGEFVYSSQSEGKVVRKNFSAFESKFVGARHITEDDSSNPDENQSGGQDSGSSSDLADRIIEIGEQYMGTPYKYGSSKNTTKTFDCSSFTQRVFKEAGITLPRDSRQQSTVGKSVSKNDLQKGDLIFMKASVNSSSDRITHVAIYAGDGKILHTYGSPGVTYSKYDNTNWEKRTVKIKRVL